MQNMVSVVILNWNGARYLEACIESVYRQSYKFIEIILVDNGSTDGSVDIVKNKYPNIRVVMHSKNIGFAQGMNTGIAVSQGEFILLLNEDVCLDTDFIANGINIFNKDSSLGWVGGLVYEWRRGEKTNVIINAASALKRRFQFVTLPNTTVQQESLMGTACAMLLRRTALDDVKIGDEDWLDHRYFAYWEDIDLALRLWLRDWKCIFTPDMFLWHVVSGSVGGKRKLVDKPITFQRMSLRNRYWTIIKDVPTEVICRFLLYLLLVELLIIPYFVHVSPRTAWCSIGAVCDTAK